MSEKTRAAVEIFVHKVSMEGLSSALENYPPGEDCPEELLHAAESATQAINDLEMVLEDLMEEYELEWS